MPQLIPRTQAMAPTHSNCIHFVPPSICSLKGIRVNPMGPACKNFQPRTFAPGYSAPFFTVPLGSGGPPMTKEQETRMLEAQAKMIKEEVKRIKRRLEELKRS